MYSPDIRARSPFVTSCSHVAALTLVTALAACSDSPTPTAAHPGAFAAVAAAPAQAVPRGRLKTIDDEYAELAQQAPGFGGLFTDSAGTATIYLTDSTAQGAAARPAVAAFLDGHGRSDLRAAINVRRGRFDYQQLASTYQQLITALTPVGITQRDIDEAHNRITIGVIDDAVATRVSGELARLDLPPGLVNVQRIGPAEITATRLTDPQIPRVGGTLIRNLTDSRGCTLGFNVRIVNQATGTTDPTPYFVTNSHCTNSFGVTDGTRFGQPTAAYPIGTEALDPGLVTSSTYSQCPPGRSCRTSDAALVRYDAGVRDSLAKVARLDGSNFINGFFHIRDAYFGLAGNADVGKVGAGTNYTGGSTVAGTGEDPLHPGYATCLLVTQYQGGIDTGRDMLCQYEANYNWSFGDSGSPVFERIPGSYDVHLVGLHWGGVRGIDGDAASNGLAVFSPWGYVQNDFERDWNGAYTIKATR